MQSLAKAIPIQVVKNEYKEPLSNWQLFLTTGALILCGSFTYSIYPVPVNAAALGIMVGLFYYTLQRQDPVSFFIQLLIGNFFIFGNKYGGNYNIAAFTSIVFYTAVNGKIRFLKSSVLDNSLKVALLIWAAFDLLSLTGGNQFSLFIEIQNFLAFIMMLFLLYLFSRVQFTQDDIFRIIIVFSLFFCYEFLVAFNQKNELYASPFPFFPQTDSNIIFDQDIVRSSSTLNNFEAYAEICVSVIALLIPGILSGSALRKSKLFYYFSIFISLVSFISIVYSGTRSSILLLPFIIISACVMLGKRLKAKIIIFIIAAVMGLGLLNLSFKFIDLSVFEERSESMDFEHLTFEKLLSGEEMNRGAVFAYAIEQIKKLNGITGKGYFVSPDEYRYVSFGTDSETFDGIADYHNLYMSAYMMWGAIGALCMLYIFFFPLWKGVKLYWANKKSNDTGFDLLLGFNLMFFFLMINQFKIQFVRDINYFTLIMLLLVCFISLTKQLAKTSQNTENNPAVL